MAVGTTMLFKAPSCLYQAPSQWGGQGICFFTNGYCFSPSYTLGYSVRAATTITALAGAAVGTKLCLWSPSLSFPCPTSPTFSNTPTFRYPDAWIFHIYLYAELGILCWFIVVWLLSLRGETKESSHSATMLIWFQYSCFINTLSFLSGFPVSPWLNKA